MNIKCETAQGGAVELNKRHGVYASYAVATIAGQSPPELLYVGANLLDGRSVQFFLNRETGLIVVDIINKRGTGGTEIFRRRAEEC